MERASRNDAKRLTLPTKRLSSSSADDFVDEMAQALTTHPKLRHLCHTASLRKPRSHVLRHLTNAVDALGRALQRHAQSPIERAIAWILRGYGATISLHMYDLLQVEEGVAAADDPDANLDPNAIARHVIQEQRLREFVKKRFPWIELHEHSVFQVSESNVDDSSVLDTTISRGDVGYQPDLTPLANFADVKHVFESGPVLELLYRRLKGALFPAPLEHIEKILKQYILYDDSSQSVAVVVEWQLLKYFEREGVRVEDLESVFTLTGEFGCARACRFYDYMCEMWDDGNKFFEVIKDLLGKVQAADPKQVKGQSFTSSMHDIEVQLFPSSSLAKEQAYIKVSGSLNQINKRIQQIAWITATLRNHYEGQLTISDIEFRAQDVVIANSLDSYSHQTVFHVSLFSREKVLSPNSAETGQCWTSAFPESVLAQGFPVSKSQRPKGASGLEVPFDIMSAFVGVRYPVLLQNRVMFAGNSGVLIPEVKVGTGGIQWHYLKSEKWIDEVSDGKNEKWDPRLETLNVSSLTTARSFLGYWRKSEVLLGTSEFKHVEAAATDIPRTSMAAFHSLEKPVRIMVNDRGVGNTADGATWKFNQGEVALMHATQLTIDERLRRASTKSVLLYDQTSYTAFLVSGLSVVMQLVTLCLYKDSQLRRNDIPVAPISTDGDGVEAAHRAIKKAKDLVVHFETGPNLKYIEIVHSFLDIMEQRETQSSIWRRHDKPPSKNVLRGWDHADIQAQKHEVWERELHLDPTSRPPLWWKLFQPSPSTTTSTLVIFTSLSKPPLRNTNRNDTDHNCRAWDTLPRGHHLLVTTTTQLDRLKTNLCQNPRARPTRYMLSDTLTWSRPTTSRLFENCHEGGACNPIQTLTDLTTITKPPTLINNTDKKTEYLIHPGPLVEANDGSGVVAFADDVGMFEARRCEFRARPRRASNRDRGWLFVGAAGVALALVYWNFWFFLGTVVVFGAVWVLYH